MTLLIQLEPEVEARLTTAAQRLGVDASQYAKLLIEQHLPSTSRSFSLQDLFAQWNEEDATTDPKELEARRCEWAEFKESINKNHSSDRVIYP